MKNEKMFFEVKNDMLVAILEDGSEVAISNNIEKNSSIISRSREDEQQVMLFSSYEDGNIQSRIEAFFNLYTQFDLETMTKSGGNLPQFQISDLSHEQMIESGIPAEYLAGVKDFGDKTRFVWRLFLVDENQNISNVMLYEPQEERLYN